jgi:diguanylate cyclase (GGDEF) domain
MSHDFDHMSIPPEKYRWLQKQARQDLFLLATAFLILLWAAYEFTIFGLMEDFPSETRIDLHETILLGVFLCVSLWVFSWRRLQEVRSEAVERARAEQRAAEAELQARLDSLTGLFNRAAFDAALADLVSREGEGGESGEVAAILLLDLNHFKQVNDCFGHPMGDAVLRNVSRRLRSGMRQQDGVFRLGGDEFAIIAYGLEASDRGGAFQAAREIAEKVMSLVDQPVSVDHQTIGVGVSIGISFHPQSGRTARELVEKADAALYTAKGESQAKGRSAYRICPESAAAILRRA